MEKGADPAIATAHGETAVNCVVQRLHGRPHAPTPDEATLCRDLLACLGGEGVKSNRGSPPNRAKSGTRSLLSHLIKPKKEFHFWQ
jgi:hypothetical protein